MSNLVRYNIPAWFILERCVPTPAQLAYGVCNGWLSSEGAVQIAAAKMDRCARVTRTEQELARTSPGDSKLVHHLMAELQVSSEPLESRARLWLFLALDWLYNNRDKFEDPWEVIEMIYADFDYPSEIDVLVRWMPHVGPEPPGMVTMEKRWQHYLLTSRQHFANPESG